MDGRNEHRLRLGLAVGMATAALLGHLHVSSRTARHRDQAIPGRRRRWEDPGRRSGSRPASSIASAGAVVLHGRRFRLGYRAQRRAAPPPPPAPRAGAPARRRRHRSSRRRHPPRRRRPRYSRGPRARWSRPSSAVRGQTDHREAEPVLAAPVDQQRHSTGDQRHGQHETPVPEERTEDGIDAVPGGAGHPHVHRQAEQHAGHDDRQADQVHTMRVRRAARAPAGRAPARPTPVAVSQPPSTTAMPARTGLSWAHAWPWTYRTNGARERSGITAARRPMAVRPPSRRARSSAGAWCAR